MAGYSQHRAGSRTSLINGAASGEQELPSGSCNFRDLSIGARAPVCGCQRFYLNVSHFQAQWQDESLDRAWCFCGHHACFHNAFGQQPRPEEQAGTASRIDAAEDVAPVPLDNDNALNVTAQRSTWTLSKAPTGLGIRPGSRSQVESINTRVWEALNDFARQQEDGAVSDTTSKLPSTAAPSIVDETRLSPNRIIQDRLQQYRSMGPPVSIPPLQPQRPAEEYSATEVATPSIAGTPDMRALASSASQAKVSPGYLPPGRLGPTNNYPDDQTNAQALAETRPGRVENQPQRPTSPVASIRDFQDIIKAYGQRLDVLETLSFSQVPVEEIQERFELFDGRLSDLEQWRTEEEQHRSSSDTDHKTSSTKRRRLLPDETGSFASDASFDSNAAAHTEAAVLATIAVHKETHPRIDALVNRVTDLESASLPSFGRPWQVQVVLLPWGRDMRGIWFSSVEATQHSIRSGTQASEEWAGTQSAPKLSFQSSVNGAWTTESIEAWASEAQGWLSPKACGPSGVVFQRLASRGLVQDVTFIASDARHIFETIDSAFGEALSNTTELDDERIQKYHGLRERFVPLRKVRKSSRLRFLSPAEMVTSASWNASFLDSSIFMKASHGQKRLYITTPDAYVQGNESGSSWQQIRNLPAFSAISNENTNTGAVAVQACWAHNESLDEPMIIQSSFESHSSKWSSRSQIDAQEREDQPMSPTSEALLPPQRTVSMPSSASAAENDKHQIPKRRVASFEPVATQPLYADEGPIENVAKRRRVSMSPEAERRGVNFTPRWSREPPSPFASEAAVESRSQGTSSRRRGTTPFAYATPHSNSNYMSRMEFVSGDGDTEADTDILGTHSDQGEEEWEGVDDGNTNIEAEDSEQESVVDGTEADQNDLDDIS